MSEEDVKVSEIKKNDGEGNDGKKSWNKPKGFRRGQRDSRDKVRPTLDVFSFNLIHLWNVSNSLNWFQLKKTLSSKFGNIKFIETFEAWAYKKIGHVVLEFETSKAMDAFVNAIKNDNFLEAGVQWEVNKNRRDFFNRILDDTGVDLLRCKGVPETFQWRTLQRSNMDPPVRTSNGWMNSSSRRNAQGPYSRLDRNQSYSKVSSDAELRSRPFQWTPSNYPAGSVPYSQLAMAQPWPAFPPSMPMAYARPPYM